MKSIDRPPLSQRVDRFLRWFFTASPHVGVEPPPVAIDVKARSRTVAQRKPTRLRAQHSGPVRVAVKAKP